MKKILLLLPALLILSTGVNAQNFGIDEPNPSEKLDVNGNIKASGLAGSDTRNLVADSDGKLVAEEPVIFSVAYENFPYTIIPQNTDSIIQFNQEYIDTGNDFDLSTGKFTVPSDGYYQFQAILNGITNTAGNSFLTFELMVNGGIAKEFFAIVSVTEFYLTMTAILELESGDEVYINWLNQSAETRFGNIPGPPFRRTTTFEGRKIY